MIRSHLFTNKPKVLANEPKALSNEPKVLSHEAKLLARLCCGCKMVGDVCRRWLVTWVQDCWACEQKVVGQASECTENQALNKK